jgi:thermolabile hemolysin
MKKAFSSILFFIYIIISTNLYADKTYKIACRYFDKNKNTRTSLLHSGLPWIWARDQRGEKIYAHGRMSDGFFLVQDLYAHKSRYENSQTSLEELCQNTLLKHFGQNNNRTLIEVQAKRSRLSAHEHPLVFDDDRENSEISRMIIFGDSLSDQGKLKERLRVFPLRPYFYGRFSDYLVWPDYFSQNTQVAVQNWSRGGSVAKKFNDINYIHKKFTRKFENLIQIKFSGTLDKEIEQFKKDALNDADIKSPNNTLFIIWIGGNDYLNLIYSEREIDTFIDQPDNYRVGSNTVVERVTKGIVVALKKLYALGARKFAVINMPDLGSTPKVAAITYFHQRRNIGDDERTLTLSQALSAITKRHNNELKLCVDEFQRKHQSAKIVHIDAFATGQVMLMSHLNKNENIIKHALAENFAKLVSFGQKTVVINRACYSGSMRAPQKNSFCTDPQKLLFFDEIHPSSYAHCLTAFYIQQALAKAGFFKEAKREDYLARCRPGLVY